MNIVVLISGNGRNLQAIIDACEAKKCSNLRAVFSSNKADAFGLERACESWHSGVSATADRFDSRDASDGADSQDRRVCARCGHRAGRFYVF